MSVIDALKTPGPIRRNSGQCAKPRSRASNHRYRIGDNDITAGRHGRRAGSEPCGPGFAPRYDFEPMRSYRITVRDQTIALRSNDTIDVLPPSIGG
uniref:Uncharacterized protein n=1 Tax=Mycobacterium leprae TaxID=1769 RepID=O33050_MYCLR|nr:hypothetical protein MLCB57.06c [Mycobacterium leprae]